MKTLATLMLTLALGGTLAQAQHIKRGDWSAGVILQTGSRRHLSGGVGAQYVAADPLRLDFNINYFGDMNYDWSVNAHYLIDLHDKKFHIYPLAGFCRASLDPDSESKRITRNGVNVGAGLEWRFDYDLAAMLEARRTIMKDIPQTVLAAGVRLTF